MAAMHSMMTQMMANCADGEEAGFIPQSNLDRCGMHLKSGR